MSCNLDDYVFPDNCRNGLKVTSIIKMGTSVFVGLKNYNNASNVWNFWTTLNYVIIAAMSGSWQAIFCNP